MAEKTTSKKTLTLKHTHSKIVSNGSLKPDIKCKPTNSKRRKPNKQPSLIRMNALDVEISKKSKAWRAHWPLALGIEKQIYKLIADDQLSASKRVVRLLIHKHCNNPNYLRNTIVGPRYDLNDASAGEVVKAEAEYAKLHLLKISSK